MAHDQEKQSRERLVDLAAAGRRGDLVFLPISRARVGAYGNTRGRQLQADGRGESKDPLGAFERSATDGIQDFRQRYFRRGIAADPRTAAVPCARTGRHAATTTTATSSAAEIVIEVFWIRRSARGSGAAGIFDRWRCRLCRSRGR